MREVSKGKAPAVSEQEAQRRRVSFKHLDSNTVSFFFACFPEKANNSDMKRLFGGCGHVEEVFDPQKLDRWGRKFGFVKFREVGDLEDLESRLEEVWLWKIRLKVNRARFGRDDQKEVGKRTNREVVDMGGGAVVQKVASNEVFSWDSVHFPALQKEIRSLEILSSEAMLEYLERSFVAKLHHNLDATAL